METSVQTRDTSSGTSVLGSDTDSTSVASSPPKVSPTPVDNSSLRPGDAGQVFADLSSYLALGCLVFENTETEDIGSENTEILDDTWHEVPSISGQLFVPASIELSLTRLLRNGWIRLQSSRCQLRRQYLIFRVYLLFNDVGLTSIERSNRTLLSDVEAVVARVHTNTALWNGQCDPGKKSHFDMWSSRDAENPSLFYMFNKLSSPSPNHREIEERYLSEGLEDLLDLDHDIAGMKTSLYPFQRRSAGCMMQRETAPKLMLDMRLESRTAADGSKFYYSPRDMQFLKEPKYQEAPRGGILAETMGYGKTLICLALILTTKHHPPKMPVQYATVPIRNKVGSLADMVISTINRRGVPYRVELDRLSKVASLGVGQALASQLEEQPASYDIPAMPIRFNRNTIVHPPAHILMASTTIVVVPQNLCKQWMAEIDKHVEQGALKVLVMDDRKKSLPPAQELVRYDIILFTRNRFDMEIQDGQDANGRRMPKNAMLCTCTYIGATRTRDCHCLSESDLYSSPLKGVHFKRLIADEGAFFGNGGTTSTILVANKLVRADHRWVVSGTPAKDLLGVEIDAQLAGSNRDATLDLRRTFDAKLDRGGAVDSLSTLASSFLRVTPWMSAEAKNYLYRHEDRRERTYSGFSVSLRRMLEAAVVKTRPEDYERDIELPPLYHEVVVLRPSFWDKQTANLFTLVLTANAVTSERTDSDYLFHKNSTKARLQLVANLRQSAFFWSGFSEADVHASVKNSRSYLAKEGTNCTPEDRQLLEETLRCTEVILASKGWTAISRCHELGVYVRDWPEESAEHWSFDNTTPLLTGLTQLLEAQNFVNARLDQRDPGEGLSGVGIKSLRDARRQAEAEDSKSVLAKSGIPTSSLDGEPVLLRRGSHSSSGKAGSRKTLYQSPRKEQKSKRRRLSEDSTSSVRESTAELSMASLPDDSPYAKSRIVGTTSAKLSYLMTRILEHYKSEKILIFYTGENAAWYVSQMLETFHIKHEIYAKSLSAKLKSQYVVNFQEQDDLRVLLMDVGQAAFGLNLCAASRVWFINPVCKPDVEAQALKRAHRIGQTRPVMCETLVLEGSIEQAMHERSQQMTKAEHLDAKALEDDGGIREIIQNARLLPLDDDELMPGPGQMAPLGKQERLWCRPGWAEFKDSARPPQPWKKAKLVDVTNPNDAGRIVIDDD
ncbi:hypothetical protein CKM354_000355200 [Cercospora kikuchii]|uniref:Helicase C-terminal domain-containing protein n=1 Tax=Cercospora kikuchii TaxID=84275 RepID=A0A9P3FF60_9PEZI|nr:uncharacterized protein CKM354_000355200 [Cercospora kikuchii]GIZ40200.1 hypothetical protein CKM354_000355200 [Cercospora kikuchii]